MCIRDRCYIVVTGTQGIGKSVFYLYFFEKYKVGCGKKIVVASYSKTRKLKECKIWDPVSGVLETSNENELPKLEGAVYLIDGIPDMEPHKSNFTIMFTSPDIRFFIYMNKYGSLLGGPSSLLLVEQNVEEIYKYTRIPLRVDRLPVEELP